MRKREQALAFLLGAFKLKLSRAKELANSLSSGERKGKSLNHIYVGSWVPNLLGIQLPLKVTAVVSVAL